MVIPCCKADPPKSAGATCLLIPPPGVSAYLKALKEKLAENGATDAEIEDFKTRVTNYYSKNIKPNFANCEFYSGNSMKEDGM